MLVGEARGNHGMIHLQLQNRGMNSFRRRGGIPSGGLARRDLLVEYSEQSLSSTTCSATLLVLIGIVDYSDHQ